MIAFAAGLAFCIVAFSVCTPKIEREADAEKPPRRPVRDSMGEEIEEKPGCDHDYDDCGCRVHRSLQNQGSTRSRESSDLHCVPGRDGEPSWANSGILID